MALYHDGVIPRWSYTLSISNPPVQAFAVFDRNKDGFVDADELRHALCSYGEAMSKEEADEVENRLTFYIFRCSFLRAEFMQYSCLEIVS